MDARLRGPTGLLLAFAAPFRAVGTLATRPRLWPFACVPLVLFVGLAAVAGPLAYDALAGWVAHVLGAGPVAGWGLGLARVLLVVVVTVAVLLLGALVVPPLAAPFMDALASRVDARPAADEPLARQIVRSLRVALGGVLVVGCAQLATWALALLAPPFAPLWIALGFVAAALGLAYDALDWPLSRRGLGVRDRVAWMRANPAVTAGLGLAIWVMFWLPGMSIAMLPATVVGAVALVNRVEGASVAGER